MKIEIRPVTAADTGALRPLLEQLGYALTEAEIKRRIARLVVSAEHCLVLAGGADGTPDALLHVYGRPALEKPPEAVVQALVVRDAARGRGIGQAMMAYAEDWAVAHGYRHVSLSSQVDREAAHEFYRRLGYDRYATSHHFRKTIPDRGASD